MNQNQIQIGGNHYKLNYQHWDFVTDTDMPYLLACATKYVTRWRKKNGLEDLKKAIHYIRKAKERSLPYKLSCDHTHRFVIQFPIKEQQIMTAICVLDLDHAVEKIEELIKSEEANNE